MAERDQAVPAPMLSHAAWVRVLPFLVYLGFLLIAELCERAGLPAQQLRWLYPLKTAAVVVTLACCWRHYTELRGGRPGPARLLLSVAAGVAVFCLWIGLNQSWMLVGTPGGYDPRTAGEIDWTLALIRVAGAALVVPVMEELFWRSFLLRWLDRGDFAAVDPARVTLRSVAIAALLFGFEHHQWLAGIVAGLVYSLLYMRTRSLWPAIVAHATTNAVLGGWVIMTASWSFW